MRKLFVSSLKMLARDKQTLVYAIIFPIIFATVFGLFDLGRAPELDIAVAGDRRSPVYAALAGGLGRIEGWTVEQRSLAVARKQLDEGDLDVVLDVPAPQPGKTTVITVLYNQANFATNQFALGAVHAIVDNMNLRLAGVSSPALAVAPKGVKARTVDYYDFLLPGLVGMGVMNFSIIGMAVAISRYRDQRILKRILATPLRPVRFLAAQVGARLVLAVVQTAIILAVGMTLFGARIYGNMLWIFVLTTTANIIFLNLGFAIAGRAPNADAAQGLGQIVALPMMFLSGVFFPTDTLPAVLQKIVHYLPLKPLIDALRKVANDGLSITSTGSQLALLGAWAVASFVIANRNFRFARG